VLREWGEDVEGVWQGKTLREVDDGVSATALMRDV
jgi:hypothetical protein